MDPRDEAIVDALLDAYRQGAFPMADSREGDVRLYTADPRGVMPLTAEEGFRVPRTVERDRRRRRFEITADADFEGVMRGCAAPRPDDGETWISEEMIAWYRALHERGHAHSVEAWATGEGGERALVGGIYGVSIGAAFFGESMFHRPRPRRPDGSRDPLDGAGASSVCLVALVEHLRRCGYRLFDTQMTTEHTARFGCRETGAGRYLESLRGAVERPDAWRPLDPERPSSGGGAT